MQLNVFRVTPTFVAEIGDVDLRSIDGATERAIKAALWRYAVLIFPEQQLSADEHLDFASIFGPRDPPFGGVDPALFRLPEGLTDVSNIQSDSKVWEEGSHMRTVREGDRLWHTDSSFNFVPALCSVLYARSITPVGGFTEFADLKAAYRALPSETKAQISPLIARHNWFHSRSLYGLTDFAESIRTANPPAPQAIVRTLAENGEKTLYLANHIEHIYGMDEAAGLALVRRLLDHATQPQFVYRHRWRRNDVVVWDNRCTMHRGTPFEDTRWPRDLQRATIIDTDNSALQEGLTLPDEAQRQAGVTPRAARMP